MIVLIVFSLNLKELKVAVLQFSGSLFQICGAQQLNAASPHLVLTLSTESRPVTDDLRGLDGSECSRESEIYLALNHSVLHKPRAVFSN